VNSVKKVIETQRLLFRELTHSDAEVMYELDSDPVVVQYAGDNTAWGSGLTALEDSAPDHNNVRYRAVYLPG